MIRRREPLSDEDSNRLTEVVGQAVTFILAEVMRDFEALDLAKARESLADVTAKAFARFGLDDRIHDIDPHTAMLRDATREAIDSILRDLPSFRRVPRR